MEEENFLTGNGETSAGVPVPLPLILVSFLKVGAFTFGGGYALLPMIQREIVYRHRWVDSTAFMDVLVVTQSLPGPLALNSAIIIGRRLRGTAGGLTAALGIVLPSFLIILILVAFLLPLVQGNPYVQAVFYGLRAAVVALVAAAAWKLGRELVRDWQSGVILALLLAPGLVLGLHPIIMLAAGGLLGLILFRWDHGGGKQGKTEIKKENG